MVYESDFYTTRRPYSSRPYVSSYSVTIKRKKPEKLSVRNVQVRQIPHLPYCAHRKLVSIVHSPVRIYHSGTYLPIKIHSRVRPSILAAELNRIRYLQRPTYVSHTEKYLNSRDYIDFDDETRAIRAKTDNLLRRIHVFVPRPVLSVYDETTPERLRSDDYVRRIINAKNARKDIEDLPWYSTPEKHRDIGSGHLACIKLVGGRPQSRRRPYFTVGDLVPGDVKSDVNLMSYYSKNRKAAEDAYPSPHVHHTERPRESHHAPAPSPTVTWADEVVQEEVEPEEEPMEQETTEVESKPSKLEQSVPTEEDIQADEYDVDGVKKTPDDDTIKKVQEYLEKKANEKKLEEERRAWEAAERKRIQEEKELARLAAIKEEEDRRRAEIKEQERLEAERQAILQKAEEARQEAERLAEDEKLLAEAVSQAMADEEERQKQQLAQEAEDAKKKQEEEEAEREVVLSVAPEVINDVASVGDPSSEEHSLHAEAELSDQDNEAKPYEVDHDEDTQIEEYEQEEVDELDNHFASTGEAASSLPVDDEPVPETPKVRQSGGAGGEQGFDWSEYESEHDADEAQKEAQPVQEEATVAAEQQQVFENSDVESQADVSEAQVVECHEEYTIQIRQEVEETDAAEEEEQQQEEEKEEVQETAEEEEVQETTQAQEVEETHETEEDEEEEVEEEVQATRQDEEAQDDDDDKVTITEIQDEEETNIIETEKAYEETKSEVRSTHDESEEEEEEEEEEGEEE